MKWEVIVLLVNVIFISLVKISVVVTSYHYYFAHKIMCGGLGSAELLQIEHFKMNFVSMSPFLYDEYDALYFKNNPCFAIFIIIYLEYQYMKFSCNLKPL